jgi:hypothetical protein
MVGKYARLLVPFIRPLCPNPIHTPNRTDTLSQNQHQTATNNEASANSGFKGKRFA